MGSWRSGSLWDQVSFTAPTCMMPCQTNSIVSSVHTLVIRGLGISHFPHTLSFTPFPPHLSFRYLKDIDLYFPQDILDSYDFVAWDPRGVAASTPVQCFKSDADFLNHFFTVFPHFKTSNKTTTVQGMETLNFLTGYSFPMTKVGIYLSE